MGILSGNKICKCPPLPPPLFYYWYYQIKSNVKSREFAVVSQSACGIVGIAPDGVERAEDAHLTLTL